MAEAPTGTWSSWWASLKAAAAQALDRARGESLDRQISRDLAHDPERHRGIVQRTLDELAAWASELARYEALARSPQATEDDRAQLEAQRQAYELLARPILDEVREVGPSLAGETGSPDKVGVAPVLVVGGLAVSALGVAACLVSYEWAVAGREQTRLAAQELGARVEAMRAGATLQDSTLPPPSSASAAPTGRAAGWVLGLGLVAAAAGVGWAMTNRSGR